MAEYSSVFEDLWDQIDVGSPVEEYLRATAAVPRPKLLLFAAHFALSEVHNGGLLQLFFNSTGTLVPEAIEGFRAIGMPETSAAMRQAAACLGEPYPRDRDERWDALLSASGLPAEELERIFAKAEHFQLAFVEATKSSPLHTLDQRVWDLACEENGGFQQNAEKWAANIRAATP